jgi:hypothetical protein
MRSVTVLCDRCRCVVVSGGSVLKIEAGDLLRLSRAPLELCPKCGDSFTSWLHSPPQGHQAGPIGPQKANGAKADRLAGATPGGDSRAF